MYFSAFRGTVIIREDTVSYSIYVNPILVETLECTEWYVFGCYHVMFRQQIPILKNFIQNKRQKWFFVESYVVTDKNKLPERDVDNDIPHLEVLEHVNNSLFRSRRSRDGTFSSFSSFTIVACLHKSRNLSCG